MLHHRPHRRVARRRLTAPPRGPRRYPATKPPRHTTAGVPVGTDFPVLAAATRYAADPQADVAPVEWDALPDEPTADQPPGDEPPYDELLQEAPVEEVPARRAARSEELREENPDLRSRRAAPPASGLPPAVGWAAFALLVVVALVAMAVVMQYDPGASDPAAVNPVPAPAATIPTTAAPAPAPVPPSARTTASDGAIDDSVLDQVPTTTPNR
ncbi:MAG TPA: hypothetical protein VFJ85_00855 [Acidimicrobiales bacterium]|nr:hypothetical protein [Acidimicrobiales bacterium]